MCCLFYGFFGFFFAKYRVICDMVVFVGFFFFVTSTFMFGIAANILCQRFFFAILGRGPRAFQIGKVSVVNP